MKSLCKATCVLSLLFVPFTVAQAQDQIELIVEMKGATGAYYTPDDFIERLDNDHYQIIAVAGPLKNFLGYDRTMYSLTIETQHNVRRVVRHIAQYFPEFEISDGGRTWSGERNQFARLSLIDAIGLSGQTDAIGLSGQTDSGICEDETFFLSDNLGDPDLLSADAVRWTNASVPVLTEVQSLSDSGDPYDALYRQRHVTSSGADWVWDEVTGEGVVVAVLDTGVDYEHEFLADAVTRHSSGYVIGRNFVEDPYRGLGDPMEVPLTDSNDGVGYGHGTHVAGIIRTIAPDARILPVRVASSTGRASLFALMCGFDFALKQGAHVINLSMSFNNDSGYLKELMQAADSKDVLVVTSAGNNANDQMSFPANVRRTLVVASVNDDLEKSCFSNFGEEVDVVAYGQGVLSAHAGGGYAFRFGTSMAAPIVAGQAALLREQRPDATSKKLHRRISRFGSELNDLLFEEGLLGSGLTDIPASLNLD